MELDSSSFFGEEKNAKELTAVLPLGVQKKQNETVDKAESVCEVKFCTGGRLSAPAILHFRDYNMRASQAIAELPAAHDHLPLITKILNSMVVEDFDCGLLHIEEAKEVLLNVHGKWWGSYLVGYRYLVNEELTEDLLTAKENISLAEIPINKIDVKPLASDIKEPISIKVRGTTVKFIYPRIRNSVIVNDLLKKTFAEQEQRFHKIKQLLLWNEKTSDPDLKKDVDVKEAQAYQDYIGERAELDLVYTRAQLICAIDDTLLETFEQRVAALTDDNKISVMHWSAFNDFLKGKGDFGVQDKVSFYSDILNKEIIRSFPFRSYSFIPSVQMDSNGIEQPEIHFGE